MELNCYISLFTQTSNQVNNRAFVQALFTSNCQAKNYVVDFENILFVSRSALHEFTVQKNRLEEQQCYVEFKNMNETVDAMFEKVLKTNLEPNKETTATKIEDFSMF